MDERVAANLALLAAVGRGEEDLHVHDRQVTDRLGRQGVDDFAVRTGDDLTGDPDQFGAGSALRQRELRGASEVTPQPQHHQLIVCPHRARDDGTGREREGTHAHALARQPVQDGVGHESADVR